MSRLGDSVKAVVVGDGGVGKTSFLVKYTTQTFPGEYLPTVSEVYGTNISVNGQIFPTTLWDVAGQDGYEAMRKNIYENADIFLLCFDIGNRASFENVREKWAKEIEEYINDEEEKKKLLMAEVKKSRFPSPKTRRRQASPLRKRIPILLCGCKADKRRTEAENCVTDIQCQGLKADIRAIRYIECSSVDEEDGLEAVVSKLVELATESRDQGIVAGGRDCTLL